jgi:hypothetical protein
VLYRTLLIQIKRMACSAGIAGMRWPRWKFVDPTTLGAAAAEFLRGELEGLAREMEMADIALDRTPPSCDSAQPFQG